MEELDPRTIASRENGKLGGPKSEAGKLRSSANAFKHGIYAKRPPVLSTEDQAVYDAFRAGMLDCHRPVGAQEAELVDQLIDNSWRIRRYESVHEILLEFTMSNQAANLAIQHPEGLDNLCRGALAIHHCLITKTNGFRELNRLLARLQRTQHRLLAELADLQGPRLNSGEHQEPESQKTSGNEPTTSTESTTPPAAETAWTPMTPAMHHLEFEEIPEREEQPSPPLVMAA